MISVSDRQLRIVAVAADLLPVEARGTFLRRVVADLRAGISATSTSNRRCTRRCSISQRVASRSDSPSWNEAARRALEGRWIVSGPIVSAPQRPSALMAAVRESNPRPVPVNINIKG